MITNKRNVYETMMSHRDNIVNNDRIESWKRKKVKILEMLYSIDQNVRLDQTSVFDDLDMTWQFVCMFCLSNTNVIKMRNRWNRKTNAKLLEFWFRCRNSAILSNLILILRTLDKVFFKKTFKSFCRNMISIECNYEIYNKKLLIIIRCLKHWRSKFENIEKFIKIFIDHKNLKIFMISKKLIFRQIRWIEILSKFNIVIQFQFEIQNVKIDVLIRMSNSKFKNDNDERHQYKKQMLFISKRFEIHVVEFDESIYERIFVVNKTNDDCKTYRETFN